MRCRRKFAQYIVPLHAEYVAVRAAEAAARPRHVADCLQFAANAWRHALSEKEKQSLRTFYDKAITSEGGSRQGDPRPNHAHPGFTRVPLSRGATCRDRRRQPAQ